MKTNRVHKATGWVAQYQPDVPDLYFLSGCATTDVIPAEIVEGEGWEDEKSEMHKLMFEIEKHFSYHEISDSIEVRDLIIEFAKNYKG